ncbi:Ribosomal large subunit pseudouridine synthase D [bioreactor metagenome]|uniref:Ribosomal large subunit pseudouridine synthase D n=1 Tax=bioreactor metagenome TaxID=1076179 RepID=A0A645DST5_9ZZZZ
MLVHPAKYSDTETLANAVMYYYQQNDMPYGFHPIHRIDRNTSGLVLVAKLPYIQHLLVKDDVKNVSRLYWGIAEGVLKCGSGVIDAPIRRHPDSIIERIVSPEGQPAVTSYRVLESLCNASLVELELKTGRTHQIRVHLAYIGHPLLGDDLYGGSTELISRQALHAVRLTFKHPATGEIVDVSSLPPEDFKKTIASLILRNNF